MSDAVVLDLITSAMWTAARISAPVLLTAVAVGVFMGLLQSVTQIQEQTLSFVPKFAAVGAVVAIAGNWMMRTMVEFTLELFERIPGLL
ncbi:MAG: flagellar biosynthesis protein FliQ [Actinomycetota bacterium]